MELQRLAHLVSSLLRGLRPFIQLICHCAGSGFSCQFGRMDNAFRELSQYLSVQSDRWQFEGMLSIGAVSY
jgi:hypothetical protein